MSERPQSDTPPGQPPESPLALYVHIPFCETKCPYCDFNTYTAIEPLIPSYCDALCREIAMWGDALGRPALSSVFFGGGTPSYLPAERIEQVMAAVSSAFRVRPDAEITLESNPGDLCERKLTAYLSCGVNRLSIGVQTFDDGLLRLLGRRHSAQEAADAYALAVYAGFDNVSIDLMYGLPHQTLDHWRSTLERTCELAPPHVSMYCLTLEDGTPMQHWVADGTLPDPDADLAADMYLLAQEAMARLDYRHYEISNWAVEGRESAHNLAYWLNQPYIGVGPGAHSHYASCRFSNIRSPREYVRRLNGDSAAAWRPDRLDSVALASMPVVHEVETIDRRLAMAETLMMGLRLDRGVEDSEFERKFGETPRSAYSEAVAELAEHGLLSAGGGRLRLTQRGRMLGNEVFSRFFE